MRTRRNVAVDPVRKCLVDYQDQIDWIRKVLAGVAESFGTGSRREKQQMLRAEKRLRRNEVLLGKARRALDRLKKTTQLRIGG